jgi:PAS domain S-box-containing protein
MIGSMLDLSEQKQAEKALAENHRFLQRLLRRVPSPVVLLDPRGHIVLFNRACEQISGFRRREVVGRTIPETILAAEDVAEFERRVADPYAPEAQVEFDCRIRTKAGELRPIEWRFTLVPAPDGGMPYMVGAGTEMEQRKTALAC